MKKYENRLLAILFMDLLMTIASSVVPHAPSVMVAIIFTDLTFMALTRLNTATAVFVRNSNDANNLYLTERAICLALSVFIPHQIFYYLAFSMSVVTLLAYAALSLNARNNSWLRGTNGALGSANLVSFTRMPLALIAPHLLYTQSLGDHSNIIALIILTIAIASDALDGFLARHFNQVTKLGKALDPVCDKFVLYPSAIVIAIMTTTTTAVSGLSIVAISAIAIRDILVIAWWLRSGRLTANGISAGACDKVRMIFICAWTIAAFIDIAFVNESWILSIRHFCLYTAGIMSVITLVVDIKRIETTKTTPV